MGCGISHKRGTLHSEIKQLHPLPTGHDSRFAVKSLQRTKLPQTFLRQKLANTQSLHSPALNIELSEMLKSLKAATYSVKFPLRVSLLALLILGFAEDPSLQVWFSDEFPFISFSTPEPCPFLWVFDLWKQIVLLTAKCVSSPECTTACTPLLRVVLKEARALSQVVQAPAVVDSLKRVGRILNDSATDDKRTVSEIHWAGAFSLIRL